MECTTVFFGSSSATLHIFLNSAYEQKTGLRHNSIRLNRLLLRLCKSCRTSFDFCRELLRTNMCPCRYKQPFFAESRHSAKCSTSTFLLVKSSACAIILASSYETFSSGFWLLGFLSPLLLHRALASCASAYCSDDLAIISTLSHQRTPA
jgi:hypothetical protein